MTKIAKLEHTIVISAIILTAITIFLHSIVLDRICVLILFVLCILFGREEKKIINPFYLFALTPLSLLVYTNIGGRYMMDLTHDTWILAIINILTFILSVKFSKPFKKISNCIGVSKNSILLTGISFFALYFLQFLLPALGSVLWFFGVGAIVCFLKMGNKWSIVLFALFVVFDAMLGTSKLAMLSYCITFLICLEKYYNVSSLSKTKTVLITPLCVVLMFFSFSFANKDRGNYDASDGLSHYESNGVEWTSSAALFLPYMYFTTPWSNLQYVTETNQRKNGLLFIKPLLGYVGLDDDYGIDNADDIFIPYSSFNTYTFIACHYSDFGPWLSILATIFLGWYVKKMYSRYLLSKSPFDTLVYCLVALATADMFFSNHFFLQSYPFTVFIAMELIKLLIPWKIKETENNSNL